MPCLLSYQTCETVIKEYKDYDLYNLYDLYDLYVIIKYL